MFFFVSSISSEKRTKTHRIVVKTNSFVRFLEEFTAWQFAFEIIWPLCPNSQNENVVLRYWVSQSWCYFDAIQNVFQWKMLYTHYAVSQKFRDILFMTLPQHEIMIFGPSWKEIGILTRLCTRKLAEWDLHSRRTYSGQNQIVMTVYL